jgi:hypothetical protein
LAVFARLAVILPALVRPLDDPDNYLPLAQALAEGRGFVFNGHPTAYRPPLYPLVLAPLVMVSGSRLAWGVFGLHIALGAATVVLVERAARGWGMRPNGRLLAAFVVACDPVLVVQCRAVMTETLAAFLVAAALATVAGRTHGPLWSAAWGGFWFGLAALCRPSTLPAAALAALAALGFGPGMLRERITRAIALGLATMCTLLPWTVRNALVLGAPIWTTTHGGYTLALANNPVYYAEVLDGPPGAVWAGPNQRKWFDWVNSATAGMSEPEADRYLRRKALEMLSEQPATFARAALMRLARFWACSPATVYGAALRVLTAAWTVPLWVALVAGLVRRDLWRWPRALAPACLVALSAVHALFWTDLRMRAPVVPAIALVAAWAVGAPRAVAPTPSGDTVQRS